MRGERGKVEQKYTDVQFFFTNVCICGIFLYLCGEIYGSHDIDIRLHPPREGAQDVGRSMRRFTTVHDARLLLRVV